jgi:hypothetical protein
MTDVTSPRLAEPRSPDTARAQATREARVVVRASEGRGVLTVQRRLGVSCVAFITDLTLRVRSK